MYSWTGITLEISGLRVWPMTLTGARQTDLAELRNHPEDKTNRKTNKQKKMHHYNLIIIKKIKYQHHSSTASFPEDLWSELGADVTKSLLMSWVTALIGGGACCYYSGKGPQPKMVLRWWTTTTLLWPKGYRTIKNVWLLFISSLNLM